MTSVKSINSAFTGSPKRNRKHPLIRSLALVTDFAAVHERGRVRVSHGGQVALGRPQAGGAAEPEGLQELPRLPRRDRHLLLPQSDERKTP